MPDTNISINGSETLRVIRDLLPRDRFGSDNSEENFERIFAVLRYMMGDTTPSTPVLEELKQQVAAAQAGLRELTIWRQSVMASIEQMTAVVTTLTEATTKVGTAITSVGDRITKLEDTIKSMGLTQEQEDAILAQLEGVGTTLSSAADSLTAMGTEPTNPVPVEPPPPVEPAPTEPPAVNPNQPSASTQRRNALGEPTGPGSAGTPPDVKDGTNMTPGGNPPVVAVDPKNDDGSGVSEPKRGQETTKK